MINIVENHSSGIGVHRLAGIVGALFFIYLSDAMLSYWVPGFLEEVLGSGLAMGLVMGFSSVIGLGVDFLFPQIFPKAKVAVLYMGAVAVAVVFAISLWGALAWPKLVILLAGMVLWGVYYELLLFANQQFVAETVRSESRSQVWSLLRMFTNVAYALGPFVVGLIIGIDEGLMLVLSMVFAVIGLGMMMVVNKRKTRIELNQELGEINIGAELRHWWELIEHMWPILLMSLMITLIDSTFWSVGAVLSARMAQNSVWAGLWLSAHMMPWLFVGLIFSRWKIYKRKKRWAAVLLLVSGLVQSMLVINLGLALGIVIVFVSSLLGAMAVPLIDAVYTDLTARMGRERKHLIGLSGATTSLAYIVGPIISGLLADVVGEVETFAVMGIAMVFVSLVVLVAMPKKLRLPQGEIAKWK